MSIDENIDPSKIEMRPIRILLNLNNPEFTDYYSKTRRIISLAPIYSNKIYEGSIKCIIGAKYYGWYDPTPFFLYEKSPRKVITGMIRLSPITWVYLKPNEMVQSKIETQYRESMKGLNGLGDNTLMGDYVSNTVRDCTAYFYVKDLLPKALFEQQAGKDTYLHVNDITKVYRFESSYEPWMLGFTSGGIRYSAIRTRDLSEHSKKSWYSKLNQEIQEALIKLKENDNAV